LVLQLGMELLLKIKINNKLYNHLWTIHLWIILTTIVWLSKFLLKHFIRTQLIVAIIRRWLRLVSQINGYKLIAKSSRLMTVRNQLSYKKELRRYFLKSISITIKIIVTKIWVLHLVKNKITISKVRTNQCLKILIGVYINKIKKHWIN
jgi:hypothetical protein